MISSGTYAGRELLSMLEGIVELNQFEVDDQVTKMNKLKGITEIILNPISTGLFCLVVALGGVFRPPSITPLSLKLDCSNFVRRYFQIG